MKQTIKNILFANGVKCDSEQFLIEDLLNFYSQTRKECYNEMREIVIQRQLAKNPIKEILKQLDEKEGK